MLQCVIPVSCLKTPMSCIHSNKWRCCCQHSSGLTNPWNMMGNRGRSENLPVFEIFMFWLWRCLAITFVLSSLTVYIRSWTCLFLRNFLECFGVWTHWGKPEIEKYVSDASKETPIPPQINYILSLFGLSFCPLPWIKFWLDCLQENRPTGFWEHL